MAYGYILIIKDRNFRVCPKSQTLATSLLYLQGVLASWVVHARGYAWEEDRLRGENYDDRCPKY